MQKELVALMRKNAKQTMALDKAARDRIAQIEAALLAKIGPKLTKQ